MGEAEAVLRRLDRGNRFVHAAVRAVAAGRELPEPPDDPAWRQRASQHGVLPVLAAHLTAGVDAELTTVRRARALQHMLTMADMRAVSRAFDAAGIAWLVFKGPVMSEIVYQRPGARGYGDLDVLVRPEDVAVAAEELIGLGARTVDGGWKAMWRLGDGESAYQLPNGTVVDLHWDVINNRRIRPAFAIDPASLFEASREVCIDGLRVRTFGAIDTVLHVAMHGCHSGGDRLRWLLDLQQSLLRTDSLPEIFDRAGTFRLELLLRCMLNRLELFVDDEPRSRSLPVPSLAERSWLSIDSAVMNRFPPGSRHEGRFSGTIVSDSTRAGPVASWRTMLRAAPGTLWGWRRAGLPVSIAG